MSLAQSTVIRNTISSFLKVGQVISNVTVSNSTMKGTRVTKLGLMSSCLTFDQFCDSEVKVDEQYLVRVKKETDFGFMVGFSNGQRAILPRAALVDSYIKEHKNLLKIGDLILVKVTQCDPEKKRFVVTSKESEISFPDWLSAEAVFDSLKDEIKLDNQLTGAKFEFGQKYPVKFDDKKAACEREVLEPVQAELPAGLTALCCGPEVQSSQESTAEAIFVGYHEKNQALFALPPKVKSDEQKVFYSNGDFSLVQNGDSIQLVLTKTIGIRDQLKRAKIVSTEVISPIGDNLTFGRLSASDEQAERKKWGIMDIAQESFNYFHLSKVRYPFFAET